MAKIQTQLNTQRKNHMTTMTKFADTLRGVNAKLGEVTAVAAALSLKEKQALLESLASDIQAAATDNPTKRLAAVQAAAASPNKRVVEAYKTATHSLAALGMKIDAIAASGDIGELDKRMKDADWKPERRIMLKHALAIVGAA
jgi:hypothetical protein